MTDKIDRLVVGQPFPTGDVPPNTMGFHPDGQLLLAGMASPTPEDIEAFHSTDGWIEFALVPLGTLLITLVRWPGERQWNDSPWAHVGGEHGNTFDLGDLGDDPDMRYTVSACLVDSDSNLVMGLRFFTLSPHYSRVYHSEMAHRLSGPAIPLEEFYRLSFEYQARYPNPNKLLDRAIARCKAGLPGK